MMTNEVLVSLYLDGDKEALDTLIRNNSNLVWKVIRSMNLIETKVYSYDDYFSIGVNGLLRAVDTYDSKRGAFTTYATNCIRTDIQLVLRHDQTKGRANDFTTVSCYSETGEDTILLDTFVDDNANVPFNLAQALLEAINVLDEDEKLFFETHYIEGDLYTRPRQHTLETLNLTLGEFKSIDRKVRIKLAKALGVDYDPKMKNTKNNVDKVLK